MTARSAATTLPFLLLLNCGLAWGAQELPKGEVVADYPYGARRMAFYLPTTYDRSVPTPILYCESADGNAAAIVTFFKDIAEKAGWIAASSYESMNGPVTPARQAVDALMVQCDRMFSVHPTLRFVAGFSGGTRRSFDLAIRRPTKIAGLFGTSSGLLEPGQYPPSDTLVWITAGQDDFRRNEIVDIYLFMESQGWPVRLVLHGDGHSWAPQGDYVDGVRWAIRSYLRLGMRVLVSDRDRVARFLESELKESERLKEAGQLYGAYEIVNDLYRFRSPFQDRFTALRGELLKQAPLQGELEALAVYQKIIKSVAASPSDTRRIRKALSDFEALTKRYPETAAARRAADLKPELESRLK